MSHEVARELDGASTTARQWPVRRLVVIACAAVVVGAVYNVVVALVTVGTRYDDFDAQVCASHLAGSIMLASDDDPTFDHRYDGDVHTIVVGWPWRSFSITVPCTCRAAGPRLSSEAGGGVGLGAARRMRPLAVGFAASALIWFGLMLMGWRVVRAARRAEVWSRIGPTDRMLHRASLFGPVAALLSVPVVVAVVQGPSSAYWLVPAGCLLAAPIALASLMLPLRAVDPRRCSRCGYDRRGSRSSRCPECGCEED